MSIEALNDYLVISPITKSGVIEVKETAVFKVVSSSPMCEVDTGEIVVVDPTQLLELCIKGEEMYFIKQDALIAKIYERE